MTKPGARSHSARAPIMPDALPALHLSNAINPSDIFEAQLKQWLPCPMSQNLCNSLGNKTVLIGPNRGGIRWDKLLKTEYGRKDSSAHNPKVAGSNPAPATNFEGRKALISFELSPSTLLPCSVVNAP